MTAHTQSALGGLLASLLNIAAALFLGGVLILAVGENPFRAYAAVLEGAFGTVDGIGYTLHYATNFIFSGLGFALAAHVRQFNIGGEGQAYFAGLIVAVLCIWLPWMPWWALLPLAVAGAALFGAAWAAVPAYLVVRRNCHLVITTIMFNFIASLLMIYLIVSVLRPAGSMAPAGPGLEPGQRLPQIIDMINSFGFRFQPAPLNVMIFVALAVSYAVYRALWRTKWGYELRAAGANDRAARVAGVPIGRMTAQAICLSGALVGLMAVNEIMGAQHRLTLDFALGYGFIGIAVALIGANTPLGIVAAAVLFGALYQGGASLVFLFPSVSREVVVVLQGLVIFFAGGLATMLRPYADALTGALLSRSTAKTEGA
ncbi:ABC transporter permease [Epibacterium sp. Ofav1-8]|uniref:ABC transporter permease n=1 Tax=Epibacterium sp. Ofav1-8 TaxID=2917735 RepID=UPI001EF4399B|nr:ABC transporter permease [Epibacterium sp. Ofav1-8]MCG7625084.1 ABC transporter permease [Epibacterium sp. Ofav1-8]